MSVQTFTPESVDIETTEDNTPALVKALYSGHGPVPQEEVDALVASLTTLPVSLSAGQALTEAADAKVTEAHAALVAARRASTEARTFVSTSRVTMARVALALTTKDVRGVATMTGADFAKALGVSAPYVSQVVSVARAMRRLGTTSPAAYSTLTEARKVSASALAGTVAKALESATVRTSEAHPADGKSDAGKSVPVRASVSEVQAARAAIVGEPSKVVAPRATPRLTAIRSTLDGILSGLESGAVGTEEDRTRTLAILATLTTAVQTVTLSA